MCTASTVAAKAAAAGPATSSSASRALAPTVAKKAQKSTSDASASGAVIALARAGARLLNQPPATVKAALRAINPLPGVCTAASKATAARQLPIAKAPLAATKPATRIGGSDAISCRDAISEELSGSSSSLTKSKAAPPPSTLLCLAGKSRCSHGARAAAVRTSRYTPIRARSAASSAGISPGWSSEARVAAATPKKLAEPPM